MLKLFEGRGECPFAGTRELRGGKSSKSRVLATGRGQCRAVQSEHRALLLCWLPWRVIAEYYTAVRGPRHTGIGGGDPECEGRRGEWGG